MSATGDKNSATHIPDLVDVMASEKNKSDGQVELELKSADADVVTQHPESAACEVPQATAPVATISLKTFGFGLLIAAVVIVLDQWTKQLATQNLELYRSHYVFDWLNMTLAHNRGAAFSFLSDAGGWQRWLFSILAAAISVMLLVWMYRLPARERVSLWALALVLGGAIGNLIDRLRFGYVVDFIDAHLADSHWPAFNIADSAISVGVALLIISMILYPQKK